MKKLLILPILFLIFGCSDDDAITLRPSNGQQNVVRIYLVAGEADYRLDQTVVIKVNGQQLVPSVSNPANGTRAYDVSQKLTDADVIEVSAYNPYNSDSSFFLGIGQDVNGDGVVAFEELATGPNSAHYESYNSPMQVTHHLSITQ